MVGDIYLASIEAPLWTSALVAIASVLLPPVMVVGPFVKVLLRFIDRALELLSKGLSEELVQDSAVQAIHEPVGPWCTDLGKAVLGVVQG